MATPNDDTSATQTPPGLPTKGDVAGDAAKKAHAGEVEMIIDTSKMNEGKRQALELTEASREQQWTKPSFAQQLFMGTFDHALIDDFPVQSAADQAIGDTFIKEFEAFLKANLDPEDVDATRTIPQAVVDGMFRMGVFAMKVPKEYGGLGFTQVNYNRVMMMLASYCASTAVLVSAHQSIGVPQPLKLFGTEAQKRAYFPRFRDHSISAFALTEPSVGSDPSKMTTTAVPTPDGKHWIINGDKLWCTNGPIADLLVVMCRTPSKIVNGKERQQITALIVEGKAPGIEIVHRCDFMGIRGIQNGLLRFKDVKVPFENVLWGEGKGLKLALTTLNTGRLTLPAACTGAAKSCLSIVRRWGNKRVQWGAAVGQHEAGRQKIAFIASHTLAMEAVTWLTSHWADQHDKDIRIEAAMAKLFCSELGCKIVDMTLQLRGGRGYEKASSLKARGEDDAYPCERMVRDMRINTIIEGTSEIMRLFLAREAMDPHLKLAADMIKGHVPIPKMMRSGVKLAGFYTGWYFSQWFNSSLWSQHDDLGKLADHYQYAHKTAHRLARTIFHNMGLYRDKLERKQVLLGHLMEIGTELFAMTATCSYARMLERTKPGDQGAIGLADYFCREATRRIEAHFLALSDNDDRMMNHLAKSVLAGEMKWMEEGAADCFPEQG